jgi:hypothetical protein
MKAGNRFRRGDFLDRMNRINRMGEFSLQIP